MRSALVAARRAATFAWAIPAKKASATSAKETARVTVSMSMWVQKSDEVERERGRESSAGRRAGGVFL
ncbi:hypothetical protein NUW54_g12473 [Trametes sanguinea]|uniref:Uncharacterized protein n=1 Tax=Trametes sanguinea TaxID=158606 RepID=A0ACC1MZB9_9APHY|nr:hypothetical protein NUW54_g12473 [Trametes sanguinea]